MSRKLTQEEVSNFFEQNGCKLISEYKNSSTPLNYQCNCGNLSKIAFSDFKRGTRCNECGKKNAKKTKMENITKKFDLKSFFKSQNCILLSEYENYFFPLKYKCSCGQIGETPWYSFKKGIRCGRCSSLRKKKYSIEEIKEIFEKNNCKLLDENYVNNSEKLNYICNCGEKSKINLNNFLKGMRCYKCGLEKNKGSNNHKWIKDREQAKYNELFRNRCCCLIHRCLKTIKKQKTEKTIQLLGYSPKELQEHIMKHPNWEHVKETDWQIDHIYPIHAFLNYGISDLKIINSLDNLQPLSKKENNEKSYKYNKKEFETWLNKLNLDKK